jgi:hypothetical protein
MSQPDLLPAERGAAETGFCFVPLRAFQMGLTVHEFRVFAQICAEAAMRPAETPDVMTLALACDLPAGVIRDGIATLEHRGMLVIDGNDWTLTGEKSWR